jgi:SAM-dependent methyltransferase
MGDLRGSWSSPNASSPDRRDSLSLSKETRPMTDGPLPAFDFQNIFGEDYLYFYEEMLTPERTVRDVDAICRLLALEIGQAVLDLGCGHGRISNALARRGARVTGVDASAYFLDRARKEATACGVDVTYVEGDMRSVPWDRAFDAVLLWFTTFGYFGDADNERVLQQAAKALKPGGRLLIEQINRMSLLRNGVPTNFVVPRGDDLLLDRVEYDGLTDRNITERIMVRNGRVTRAKFFVRLYGPSEFSSLLRDAGFRSFEFFGENGEPFALYGRRVIVVATA